MAFYNEFDIKQYPLLPIPNFCHTEGWEDTSWHNDAMPSFRNDKLQITVWINFKDPKHRECDCASPYVVQWINDHAEYLGDICATDDIEIVEKLITYLEAGPKSSER